MNLARSIKKEEEKKKLKEIRETYDKKPKNVCPRCHKRALFFINSKNEIYCVRCDNMVGKVK